MSETSKAAETAKKAMDNTARSSQTAIETAGKAMKESISETDHRARNAASDTAEAGQSTTETVVEAANAAANLSTKAAEQGREVLMIGMRTAADVGSRVADISFGRSHHIVASTAQAMDIYRDVSERSAERIQSLLSSAVTFGRGLQQMQQAWLEMFDHTRENGTPKPHDLLRCKNIVEVAEVQRDLYLNAVNRAFESTTRLLDLAGRTAQDAVRPLQSHKH
jgi:hypothetical protein